MRLESFSVLTLFLNFSDFEPEYSYQQYSLNKECTRFFIKIHFVSNLVLDCLKIKKLLELQEKR